jgi:hypothetical protein
MPLRKPRINQRLVNFFASKLRHELGFRVPIFFQVFLIIRLFGFIPHPYITQKQYKAARLRIFKIILGHHLYEAGCSGHYQMHKWWNKSQPLHRHQFLGVMFNRDYFKPRIFEPLYSTAQNGFSNSKFHELCDKKGPTMTVYTLNGKMVVAILQKSWNVLDYGWNYDPDLQIFFVDDDGTTTELECTCETEKQKYLNGSLCGPHVGGLPLNLTSPRCGVYFLQRELITGSPQIFHANIDSVVVLQMSICLETVSPLILTRVVRMFALYCRIGGGEVSFPYYPPMLL